MILLILFIVSMFLWLLVELGAISVPRSGLIAWIAVLLLFCVFHGVRL